VFIVLYVLLDKWLLKPYASVFHSIVVCIPLQVMGTTMKPVYRRRPRVDPSKLDIEQLTGDENVTVVNRNTGKRITGAKAPTLRNLRDWLIRNPGFDVDAKWAHIVHKAVSTCVGPFLSARCSALDACMGLELTGIPRLPRDSHGFAFIHYGKPNGLGLMSRESHGYGMDHLRESHGVDGPKFLADMRVITCDKRNQQNSATAAL